LQAKVGHAPSRDSACDLNGVYEDDKNHARIKRFDQFAVTAKIRLQAAPATKAHSLRQPTNLGFLLKIA